MSLGEKAMLMIPCSSAYGATGDDLDDMTWGRFFDLFFSLENKRESENHLF